MMNQPPRKVDQHDRFRLEATTIRAEAGGSVTRDPATTAQLERVLLPQERLTFVSRPHVVVLIRPAFWMALWAVAIAVALTWRVHPIVNGHHVQLPWLDARMRIVAWSVGGLALLRAFLSLCRNLDYFISFRIITTNRRVFTIKGLFSRRLRPLPNTGMAGASLEQGVLGRQLGYGTITANTFRLRELTNPVELYRNLQAVSNGVDGDTWTPAVRQTVIP